MPKTVSVDGYYVRFRVKHGTYGYGPWPDAASAEAWINQHRILLRGRERGDTYIEQVTHHLKPGESLEFRKESPRVRKG